MFKNPCEPGFFTVKFHFLDRLSEDLDKFGSVRLPSVSAWESLNVVLKIAKQKTSLRGVEESA